MIVSLLGAMVFAAQAQAAPPASAGWRLHEDPALCVLERRNAASPDALSITTMPGSDAYRLAVVTTAISKQLSFAPASLRFAPSQKALDGRANAARLPDGARMVWIEDVGPDLLDALSGAESVTLALRSKESVAVPVPGSVKAVEAFRRCSAAQLIEWGADAAQFAPGGTMPVARTDRSGWLSLRELLKAKGQSRRRDIDDAFRVTVSPAGAIDDCRALRDETEKGLEKIACAAVLGKPLFTAARDPGGRPVRGAATFRVRLISRETSVPAGAPPPAR